jgi:hypothetical protein
MGAVWFSSGLKACKGTVPHSGSTPDASTIFNQRREVMPQKQKPEKQKPFNIHPDYDHEKRSPDEMDKRQFNPGKTPGGQTFDPLTKEWVKTTRANISMSPSNHRKLLALGGATWLNIFLNSIKPEDIPGICVKTHCKDKKLISTLVLVDKPPSEMEIELKIRGDRSRK